ncbi:7-carboxy-7-deazaguanine synthase QueE [Hydrogenimonas sp.]
MMIPLVEHFFSIQGEGRYVGSPSVFLRFGGCNLRCPGFGLHEIGGEMVGGCDTVRAVDAKRFGKRWERVETGDLIGVVESYRTPLDYTPDVVITGGEPMIHATDPGFYGLVEWLVSEGFRVTVETNATIAPDFSAYPAYRHIVFAMAVKLSNSGEAKRKRVVPSAIEALAEGGKEAFFKFTVSRELAESSAHDEIEEIRSGRRDEVICMPLGKDIEELRIHAEAVALFCMKHGYRYGDRLHIRLWNDEEKR